MGQSPKTWVFTIFFLFSYRGLGQDLIHYSPESEKITELLVKNTSLETQDLWLIFYDNQYLDEAHFEIPAQAEKRLKIADLKESHWNFAVLTKSTELRLPANWQSHVSTRFEKNVRGLSQWKVRPTNLGMEKQELEVQFQNSKGEILETQKILSSNYLKSQSLNLKVPQGAEKAVVQTHFPISLPQEKDLKVVLDSSRKKESDTVYFLLEYEPGSTFVAPIKDPRLVAQAREEIKNPKGLILFAEIDHSGTGLNRNWSLTHQPYWSWQIKEVTGFYQLAADWCQAYPEMIERMLHPLVTQEKVCFGGSQLVSEVSAPE